MIFKNDHDSVICYSTARIIEDIDQRCKVLNNFNHCLQPDAKEINREEVLNCLAIEIRINKMTGRQQRKGKNILTGNTISKSKKHTKG